MVLGCAHLPDARFLRIDNGVVVAASVVADPNGCIAGAVSPVENVHRYRAPLWYIDLDGTVEQLASGLHFRVVSVDAILLLPVDVAIERL